MSNSLIWKLEDLFQQANQYHTGRFAEAVIDEYLDGTDFFGDGEEIVIEQVTQEMIDDILRLKQAIIQCLPELRKVAKDQDYSYEHQHYPSYHVDEAVEQKEYV